MGVEAIGPDRQSGGLPLGHHRETGRPVGIPTPISAFGALCPVRLDDRPQTWYGYEESNPNLNVRSVPSCPLNDTRKKLAGRPGLQPGTSAFRARRAANCASGQWQGGEQIERPKPASKTGGFPLTEPP